MASTGRPKAILDWGQIGKLLEAGCTAESIAGQFGVSRAALWRRCKTDRGETFSAFAQQRRMTGENLLRAKQFQHAMAGNTTMLIWLGKQRLGQRDKMGITGEDGGAIAFTTDLSGLSDEELQTLADLVARLQPNKG